MDEDYKKRSKRVAICLITDHRDNVLMGIRNDCGKWAAPGGHLEDGEDPYEGALRELREETMLDADYIQLIRAEYDKEYRVMLYLFKVIPHGPQMPDPSNDPDQEFEFLDYVDPNDTIDNLHIPLYRNIVLKYWANN